MLVASMFIFTSVAKCWSRMELKAELKSVNRIRLEIRGFQVLQGVVGCCVDCILIRQVGLVGIFKWILVFRPSN